jgi:subtilase family serine protease
LVPGDLHTLYHFNPLYDAGITGRGQTIVVLEDSDLYSATDWQTFRKAFGLADRFPHGSLQQIHPQASSRRGGAACTDPGVTTNGDDFEATLDTEWASVAAPDAAIVAASCASADTNFQDGAFVALQNLVAGELPVPPIISISWGEGEAEGGAAYNAFINQLYEVAVLEGASIFVSSGDSGPDGDSVDFENLFSPAQHGINVNGEASTPFNVAVGGTDFSDIYAGETSQYWKSVNGPFYESALSYIPEMPWSGACANSIVAGFYGFSVSYGANGFCNSTTTEQNGPYTGTGDEFTFANAGGGGPSACAYGSAATPGVVSGTCRGYAKPSYQHLAPGNPRDGVRDLPDVALFGSNGVWFHYYLVCYTNPAPGRDGLPCTGAPMFWSGGGGTSFSAPIMAGIQALIDQATGQRQGNPNYALYSLAATNDLLSAGRCNATLGSGIDSRCLFHDVTIGDNEVACAPLTDSNGTVIGTFNCYIPGGTVGVSSTSNTEYQPAFKATPGWDFATGLGSVDAYNLVRAWPGSRAH